MATVGIVIDPIELQRAFEGRSSRLVDSTFGRNPHQLLFRWIDRRHTQRIPLLARHEIGAVAQISGEKIERTLVGGVHQIHRSVFTHRSRNRMVEVRKRNLLVDLRSHVDQHRIGRNVGETQHRNE